MRDTGGARLTGLILVVAMTPWLAARAQGIAEMERRVDSLVAMRERASVRLVERDARKPAVIRYTDTLAILDGAMRVITQRELLEIAKGALPTVEAFVRGRAGQARELEGAVIALSVDSPTRADHGVRIDYFNGTRPLRSPDVVIANTQSLIRALEDYAGWLLGLNGKTVFNGWLGANLPVDSASGETWRALRVELVSSRARVARRCYDGDIAACKITLGLAREADPVTAWYDSAGRRAIAADNQTPWGIPIPGAARCLTGNDSVCIAFMRASPSLPEWVAPPGSQKARMALLQQAIAMHPAASFARIAASDDSVNVILSAIATAPLDSIVARWQHNVRNGGVESQSAPRRMVLFGFGWVVIMAGLSFRSSRWR